MNIEEKIKDCEFFLKQINHFNPDPYYVDYFFKAYLQSVIDVYDEIFTEANRDFGLFISGKCTPEKFERKATEKSDHLALRFLSWFKENYEKEHTSPYSNFITKISGFFKEGNHLPKITIKIRANQRYQEDISQSIQVGLTDGKIRSKEELQIEIKRQTPVFLEIINQKRKINNEPKVSENQILASTYLDMNNFEDIEISHACEIYLPVLRRFLDESRNEIRKLTSWAS
ncbi:MAG TPA: hypothetical protein VMZ91_04715 [Candidatus Paceibacterota bacterium]|nr:hypothetical protein [Candidatus Paceibacterota bacterium]